MEKLLPIGNNKGVYVNNVHTFGTDAVLLSNFAAPKPGQTVVDIGTGCGIIPFLWLKDNFNINVTGIEIQKDAANLCKKTAKEQNMPLNVLNINANDVLGYINKNSVDLITCNPPYKTVKNTIISPNINRAMQRHELTLTLLDIANIAKNLLKFGGNICICVRAERLFEAASLFTNAGILPKRLRLVCKNKEASPKLILLECKKGAKHGVKIMPPLFLKSESGEDSDEIKQIYKSIIN